MEREKNNKFTDLHFFIRSLLRQTKVLELLKKKRYSGSVRLTKVPNEAKLQAVVDGAQWLSGRVLDSRLKGRGFEPHWRHCVVVLEQDTFILP